MPPRAWILLSVLATSLSVAFLDAAFGLLRRLPPEGLLFVPRPLAATAFFVALVHAGAWALFLLTNRAGRLAIPPAAGSLAFVVASIALYASVEGFRPRGAPLGAWAAFAFFLVVVGTGAAALHLCLSRVAPPSRLEAALLAVATAAPPAAALALGFVAVQRLFVEGTFSSLGLGTTFVYLAATFWLLRRLGRMPARTSLALLASLYAIVVAGPIVVPADRGAKLLRPRAEAASPEGGPRLAILLTVDTLRADAVSCQDPQLGPTPNIARLCRDGIVFEHALSPAPWTVPALLSIMTGLPPDVHGAINDRARVPSGLSFLAERLRASGYRTDAIVANPLLFPADWAAGFDRFVYVRDAEDGASLGSDLAGWLVPPGRSTERVTEAAVARFGDQGARRSFLWVHYLDPHRPYAPPREMLKGEPPPSVGHAFSRLEEIRTGRFVPDAAERAWIRRLYDLETRYVDSRVGAVLDALRGAGLYDDALIALTSDHGEEFWEHGGFEHGHTLYGELLRVPLILKLPGSRQAQVVREPVSTLDLTATLLDLCRAPADPALPSTSLRPLWEGGAWVPRPALSTGLLTNEDSVSLVSGNHKYIRGLTSAREELYDLQADPAEQRSVADLDTAVLERVRRLTDEALAAGRRERRRLGLLDGAGRGPERALQDGLRALGYAR